MARLTVEPQTTKTDDRLHESKITHPSFAQISVSRVSGGAVLYGSDFVHQHFITLRIAPSELNRGLSRDWPHASRKSYIEVEMSEAQFASMICSMNVGEGAQCTLTRFDGEMIPGIPSPINRTEQFRAEADKTVQEGHAALDTLDAELDGLGLSAKRLKEIKWKVEQARRAIGSSIDFVASQFGEHMEKTVEKAKIEVNAYITGAVQRVGLESLGVRPISLPDAEKPE